MLLIAFVLIIFHVHSIQTRLVLRSKYDLYFFHDYHVYLTAGSHNYEQAKSLCESLGGHLPSYHSQDDIDFVLNKLIGDRSRGAYIWSGLYWSDTKNSQAWLDGSEFDVYQWTTVPQFFQDPSRSDKATDENRWTLGHYYFTGKHWGVHRSYQQRVVCRMNLTDPDVCRKLTSPTTPLQRLDPHEAKWICSKLEPPASSITTEATTTTTTVSTKTVPPVAPQLVTDDGRRAQWDAEYTCPPCPRCCPYG